MKPIYEKLTHSPDEGFSLKEIHGPACDCPWHFHSESELILTRRSRGYRMVGDNITWLEPGDLVFIGANLPHMYQHHVLSRGEKPADCLLLQFEEASWSGLLQLPALVPVQKLLRRAAFGLQFTGRTRDEVAELMARMLRLRGLKRIAAFLQVLDVLAASRTAKAIASPGFSFSANPYAEKRINQACDFIAGRLGQPISLVQVARLVHMSEGAFSRFFHTHLGKTFPQFVNELRVGRACRFLAETEMPIIEVALECGYPNLSNFNRQFRRLKGVNPREFRRRANPDPG